MYTSVVLVALAGAVAEPALASESPTWRTDYTAAAREGERTHKPLAVFIGHGAKGWEQVSKDGRLSPEARKLLEANYVCVYLDTHQKEGRRTAALFELGSNPGLVLSDHSGENQAFRHPGTLSDGDLETTLKKYADPERVVRRTDTLAGQEVRSFYYAPATVPVYQGFGGYGGYGGFGGFSGGRGGC
jgi:hypothetical protein